MNLAKAYSLFMHGLNPQLRQLAGTMVISGDLEEVIEIVKKVMVYGGCARRRNMQGLRCLQYAQCHNCSPAKPVPIFRRVY